MGFLRRDDMRKSFGQFRFSPRPASIKAIRKFSGTRAFSYIESGDGRLDTRALDSEFAIEFQNNDRFSVGANATYEFLPRPFAIAPTVTIPVGGYDYASVRTGFNLGQQRQVSGFVSAEYGTFYNGHKTTLGVSSGRVNLGTRFSVEPTYSINRVDLVQGSFTTHLAGSRATWTATPLMFTSALVQYNSGSHALSANVRLRWEYRPGSELFVVYNEERDTLTRRFPDLANRALIVKVNRLMRF